jgi:hypothetical protein
MERVGNITIEASVCDSSVADTDTGAIRGVADTVVRAPAVVGTLGARAVYVPEGIVALALGSVAAHGLIEAGVTHIKSRKARAIARAVVGAPRGKTVQLIRPWLLARAAARVMITDAMAIAIARTHGGATGPKCLPTARRQTTPIIDEEIRVELRSCVVALDLRQSQLTKAIIAKHVDMCQPVRPAVQQALLFAMILVGSVAIKKHLRRLVRNGRRKVQQITGVLKGRVFSRRHTPLGVSPCVVGARYGA